MFSLDVIQWRRKRSEKDAVCNKYKASTPSPLPRVNQERRTKQIYGKSTQQMHEAYRERVDQWIKDAPTTEWSKGYAKENYSKEYIPRVRRKELEHGGPNVKTGAYSPRAVFKGGGKCVRVIVDSHAPPSEELPRDEYRERIVNVEKTREKDKEIQRPMAIPSNKPLSCGKYFVKDVLSNSSNSGHLANNDTNADHDAARRHYAHYPPSPEKDNAGDTLTHQESAEEESVYARLYHNAHGSRPTLRGALALPETPTTGEYVSHPQWRDPNPRKWVGGKFVSTVASTNVHTAHQRSIDGSAAGPTLLIEDQYAPISVFPLPTSPAVHEFEHQRRAKTAASLAQRPVQKANKKYFCSMWTEPRPGTVAVGFDPDQCTTGSHAAQSSPSPPRVSSPTRNPGRALVQSLRTDQQPTPSAKSSKSRSG